MTTGGWVMMLTTFTAVISVTIFCIVRLLQKR